MFRCPYCQGVVEDDTAFCPLCGNDIRSAAQEHANMIQKNPQNNYRNGYQNNLQDQNKNNGGGLKIALIIMILICALVLGGLVGFLLLSKDKDSKEETTETVSVVEESTSDSDEEETEEEDAKEDDADQVGDANQASDADQAEDAAVEEIEEPIGIVEVEAPAVTDSAIVQISSSSYMTEPQYNLVHDPTKLMDHDTTTAWVEDVPGQGENQYISIELKSDCLVSGIKINNGHQYSSDIYYKNSRPKTIEITTSDGVSVETTLSDEMGQQVIKFVDPVVSSKVTITIKSVYPGSKYEDTCISELYLF